MTQCTNDSCPSRQKCGTYKKGLALQTRFRFIHGYDSDGNKKLKCKFYSKINLRML